MAAPPIQIDGVSKRYRLGGGVGFEGEVSQRVDSAIRRPLRRLLGRPPDDHETQGEQFWALKDVSLEVAEGEVLGLIGANGAGKSTLLKMLARITPPDEGRIILRGQVGSLLEVGTGFHPELSGRENIFLNGSILGMRRQEIMDRYDEIVEFSGIERFIETPVKRYSSGMFVRLAFSVAAYLEPEILLIDEVLSVGDSEFQTKSLAKMESIAHDGGHTIVYVSHSLGSVRRICDRVALIEGGRLIAQGPTESIIANYMRRVEPVQHGGVSAISDDADRIGTGEVKLREVSLLDPNGTPISVSPFGQPLRLAIEGDVLSEVKDATVTVILSTPEGVKVLNSVHSDHNLQAVTLTKGKMRAEVQIDARVLPGEFVVDVVVGDSEGKSVDHVERVISFTVSTEGPLGEQDAYPWETSHGFVQPDATWTVSQGTTELTESQAAR